MAKISDIFQKILSFNSNVQESLEEVAELDITCKTLLERYLMNIESADGSTISKIQAILDYMYEQVNVGNWKEVRLFLRKTITIASYLRLLLHLKGCDEMTEEFMKEAFKIIDFGIMFGCPVDTNPQLLQNCATVLSPLQCTQPISDSGGDLCNKTIEKVDLPKDSTNVTVIDVIDCPSMEHFYANYILKETPVVLDNCINHWPALTKWQDQNYFIKLAGLRTVSIELGRDYTDSEWTQKLMTIEEFIKNHVNQSEGPTGYLAQYQLFDQIPELKDDIIEPEYCCFSDKDTPVSIMAWYGPKGTVSPLHYDAKRNLLAQVIGEKQIFIFSPGDSEYLYPHNHELVQNTAKVDPRQPDLEKFPKYKEAKIYYCVLRPGQMLYIPPNWWHFVESLAVSFSVNFWWE